MADAIGWGSGVWGRVSWGMDLVELLPTGQSLTSSHGTLSAILSFALTGVGAASATGAMVATGAALVDVTGSGVTINQTSITQFGIAFSVTGSSLSVTAGVMLCWVQDVGTVSNSWVIDPGIAGSSWTNITGDTSSTWVDLDV